MVGNLKDFEYECTNISAAALLAAYGFVGARMLVSSKSSSSSSTSPYTSSDISQYKPAFPFWNTLLKVGISKILDSPHDRPKGENRLTCGDMDELLDSNLFGTLKQDVCAKYVIVGESVGISEAQVDMGLSSKVKNGVDFITLKAVHDFRRISDIAMIEAEVPLVIKCSCVVQRGAVVELVERDDIVCIGICHCQVSYQPASTMKDI